MKILFLHNNYPAQFMQIAAALASNPQNEVVFLAQYNRRTELQLKNVRYVQVEHAPAADTKNKSEKIVVDNLRTGEAYANAMLKLAKSGFTPHVVYDHPGWGAGLFVKDIFPMSARVCFFEWFYSQGADYAFMARGKQQHPKNFSANRMRNHCQLDALRECDMGIVPTYWQFAQYPVEFSSKLHILHDGIDTMYFSPQSDAPCVIDGLDLSAMPEIVTYATRGLEPYRGFPQFYRSVAKILEERPQCHVVIMADDKTNYSAPRSDGKTWGEAMRAEVSVDMSRVHFIKFGSYDEYRSLLRASTVHVYLTVPFVLSWSMLEAMSCECLVVGSATEPVREVLQHGENGLLAPFWNHEALANTVIKALENPAKHSSLRKAARQTILNRYDRTKVIPQQIRILEMAAFLKGSLIQQYALQKEQQTAEVSAE